MAAQTLGSALAEQSQEGARAALTPGDFAEARMPGDALEARSWTKPAEMTESWTGPAETKEGWMGPAETKEGSCEEQALGRGPEQKTQGVSPCPNALEQVPVGLPYSRPLTNSLSSPL